MQYRRIIARVMPVLFTFNIQTKFESLASSAPEIWPGLKNVEMGHVTPATPTSGIVSHHKANISCGKLVYKIWSL